MMNCPACISKELKNFSSGNVSAHVCGDCHGLWFTKKEIEEITEDLPHEGWIDIDLWEQGNHFDATIVVHRCPNDQDQLFRVSKSDNGLAIEFCKKCGGIWLEGGEYKKMKGYMKDIAHGEAMSSYSDLVVREISLLFSHPENAHTELKNLRDLIGFFQARFATLHPRVVQFLEEFSLSK